MLWYFVLLLVLVATLVWMIWDCPIQDGRISGPYIITREHRLYDEKLQNMSEDEKWGRK